MFLPVRNPYDRQVLVEHVGERVRAKGQVQVLTADRLWMVHRNRRGPGAAHCTRCGLTATTACYSGGCDDACYCVACALDDDVEPMQHPHTSERRAG